MKPHVFSPVSRFGGAMLALILTCAGLHAAQPALGTNAEGRKSVPYRINRNDTLAVSVFGEPDLTGGNRRVDTRGSIELPLIGTVNVYGLTLPEAATVVENAYKDGRILRNPQVTVLVETYAERVVNVIGNVKYPQRVLLPPEEQWTIKDVITKCGGFDDKAKGTGVKVTRRLPDGAYKTFILDVQSAILGKDRSTSGDASFVVEPGDDVYVPEKLI
jgi:polysaccharide export outer membrane protein